MIVKIPRVVVVTRETAYERLLATHATHAQAAFFLSTRDQSIDETKKQHDDFHHALHVVTTAIPGRWRTTRIGRQELDRFLFEPDDIVVVVGQDGLVANVAKYLRGQPVIGINPNPRQFDGILVRHQPDDLHTLLTATADKAAKLEPRTMVEARLDDGQQLFSLNEVFIGVRSHQSARYTIRFDGQQERQSSSGLIVATGTGSTGWAKSMHRERKSRLELPEPESHRLAFFVREPFPSVTTGTTLSEGILDEGQSLAVTSETDDGAVVFGDGIESDNLRFDWGKTVTVRAASEKLMLVSQGF